MFSLRVLAALVIFALSSTAGLMALAGPELVLGPRGDLKQPSLRSVRLVGGPGSAQARVLPPVIGPGADFSLYLTIPGGLDGHARVTEVAVETDHPAWPGGTLRPRIHDHWPNFMPDSVPAPVSVIIRGLGVPADRRLVMATVNLRLTVRGVRPELDENQFLIDAPFEETVAIGCNLGWGNIEPTGLLNFDPYNRTTCGLVAILGVLVVTRLLRGQRPQLMALSEFDRRRPDR